MPMMKLLRRLLASLGMILFLAGFSFGQASPPIFPLSQVRPGLKGVGRTIFQGDKIEEFQVEILGVLKNALAPKRSLILARLSGGPLATTGVISGMSGSPVYIDGKLVGAVSRSFQLSKEPIAGITPIEDMMRVVPSPSAASTPALANDAYRIAPGFGGASESGRLIPNNEADAETPAATGAPDSTGLSSLLLPLRFGGFSDAAVDLFRPQLRRLGLEPMQGGVVSGGEQDARPSPTDLQPGSMISLLLIRGDLDLNIDCTVTYRQGNQLYACGHQVLAEGPAAFPFAPSHVIVVVPSIASSFKLDAPGALAGVIQQDRFDAIYGRVGEKAPLIPVHLHLDSSLHRKDTYNFQMVDDPFLSPLLLNLSVTSALTISEREIGTSTLSVKSQIRLAGGQSIDLEDILSTDTGTSNIVGSVVAAPLSLLMSSGFPDLKVQDIEMNVVSVDEKRNATIEQIWSTKSEVRPGDHLVVSVLLRLPTGETLTEQIPVDIPTSVTDKMLSLVVGGGSSINSMEFRFSALGGLPRDSQQLVNALNKMRRNNRVYGLLMSPQRSFAMMGDQYPSPPPSLLQTFMADSAASSSVVFSGTSIVGDYETAPTPYAIHGQKTLLLKLAGTGM